MKNIKIVELTEKEFNSICGGKVKWIYTEKGWIIDRIGFTLT